MKLLDKKIIIFFIFLFFGVFVNFEEYFSGTLLLLVSILLNFLVCIYLTLKKINLFPNYFLISIVVFNFLINEIKLFNLYRLVDLTNYFNVLTVSIFVPVFIIYIASMKIFQEENKVIFNTLYFVSYGALIEFSNYFSEKIFFIKNLEFYIFLIYFLISLFPKRLLNKQIVICFLIFKLFNPLTVFLIVYFTYELLKQKHYVFIFSQIYLYSFTLFSLPNFYQTVKNQVNNYTWFLVGLKSNFNNLQVYEAGLDIKGFLFFEIYKAASIFVELLNINQWSVFVFIALVFVFTTNIFMYKILKKLDLNLLTITFIQYFVSHEILFDSHTTQIGARYIGSLFILIGIYLFTNKKYFLSTFFLISSIFALISFIIPLFFIVIYIFYLEKNMIIRLNLYFFINLSAFIIYLLVTGQLYEFWILNFDFVINYRNTYVNDYLTVEPFGFLNIIRKFMIPMTIVLYGLIYSSKIKKYTNLEKLILIWFFSELIHLLLSQSLFDIYKNMLIIPLYLILALSFAKHNFLFENKKILIFIFLVIFSYYGTPVYENYNVVKSEVSLKDFELNNNTKKEDYEYALILSEYEPDIFIELLDEQSLIASSRIWSLLIDKNTTGFEKNELLTYFKNDLYYENPTKIIVSKDYELSRTYLFLQNYLSNKNLIECKKTYCIYENG